jgi:hypothetical protein
LCSSPGKFGCAIGSGLSGKKRKKEIAARLFAASFLHVPAADDNGVQLSLRLTTGPRKAQ